MECPTVRTNRIQPLFIVDFFSSQVKESRGRMKWTCFAATATRQWWAFLFLGLIYCIGAKIENPYSHLMCRDPSFGFGNNQLEDRKFLILAGKGNGLGNYLLYYPGVYYFAALTGRVSQLLYLQSFLFYPT